MWVKESEKAKQARRDAGEDVPEGSNIASFGRSSFGERFKMNKFLDNVNEADMQERCVCLLCGDVPQDPQETDYMECPQCHRVFSEIVPYKQIRLHDDDNDDGSPTPSNNGDFSTRGGGGKQNDSLKTTPQIRNSEWLKLVLNKKAEFLPSAELIALKAQILNWLNDAPEDKILIFTQFLLMARLIGLLAEKEGWNFVYFTGDMNRSLRHSAVQRFHDDKNVRIMIASLKCGGQALNLTCANRVISIDLWWNHSVEQQAFGRVFRIGQHKETYVACFVVKNSVDARMPGMQVDKIKLIDRALQDTGNVVDPLTIHDLASLFGHLKEDADGEIRVERDYRDDDDEIEVEDGEEGTNGSGSGEGRTNETEADGKGHADEGS